MKRWEVGRSVEVAGPEFNLAIVLFVEHSTNTFLIRSKDRCNRVGIFYEMNVIRLCAGFLRKEEVPNALQGE